MYRKELHSSLYSFIMEVKFRWYRNILLIFSIGIILANHIFVTYEGHTGNMNAYWIMTLYMSIYLSVLYLNLYSLIPRLLLKGKYAEYALILLGTMFVLSLGDICAEYHINQYKNISFYRYFFFSPERNRIIDLLSNSFVFTLYIVSVSVVDFYRHWLTNAEEIERLKTKQLYSELDNLKSWINTGFFSDKLHTAAGFCMTYPVKSSRILLQLSRVLRYQLYDCNREYVLLKSDIKFLYDYLDLEKMCNDNLDFKIVVSEILPNCFIPSMLLKSIVDESLKYLPARIDLELNITNDSLVFTCLDNRRIGAMSGYSAISKRMDLLPSKNYTLNYGWDKKSNQYEIVFQYKI